MLKENFKSTLIKYIMLSVILILISPAQVNGLQPFGLGAYMALVFAGCNAAVLVLPLAVGCFIGSFDWISTAAAVLGAGITVAVDYFLTRQKRPYGIVIMICLSIISFCPVAAVNALTGAPAVYVIINVCLYLIFTYVAYGIAKPLLYYKIKHSLLDTEKTCLYVVVVVTAMGISALGVPGNIPLFVVVGAALPFTCRFIGKGACVMTALSLGLGSAFYTLDVTNVALFGFIALACSMFITSPRVLSPLAQIFAAVIFELFFNVPYVDLGYHAASLLAGGIVYAAVPEKTVNFIREKFFSSHSGIAVRYIINRNRADLARKARSVGDVFNEMSDILGGMEKTGETAVVSIAKEVTKSVCVGCQRYKQCLKEGLEECMLHVAAKSFEKGKASMSDLPFLLVDKCLYVGKIMSLCSSKVAALGMSRESIETDNKVTRLLARQLGGVGKILSGMSRNVDAPVNYDRRLENRIKEELKYYNVVCSEILLCLGETVSATAIVRNECVSDKKLIADVIGKCSGTRLSLKSVDDSVISGWSVMEFAPKPRLDVTFGVATRALKKEATGDTHSFMKIGSDKFLMAVCDGMGSGKKAYELSEKAMSLVEGFYKAGFDHDVTVEGINTFLGIEEGESFSALDIAVVDLDKCSVDMVKLAAPTSFIKRSDSVEPIVSSSLPLGVVDDAKPSVFQADIVGGDAIVIVSDGVFQRFADDELAALINNSPSVNPQLLADTVMQRALEKEACCDDDMTVAVCRVAERE